MSSNITAIWLRRGILEHSLVWRGYTMMDQGQFHEVLRMRYFILGLWRDNIGPRTGKSSGKSHKGKLCLVLRLVISVLCICAVKEFLNLSKKPKFGFNGVLIWYPPLPPLPHFTYARVTQQRSMGWECYIF